MQNKLANHIVILHEQRKQDGVLFIGNYIERTWLDYLLFRASSILRTDSPIFMHIGLSQIIQFSLYYADHRLDNNILFYERKDSSYKLMDIFAVNGGPPLIFEIGSWADGKGVLLKESMNRWDRRKDLMGATFVNTLHENGNMAKFIYDEKEAIIGSDGWFQEILFYVNIPSESNPSDDPSRGPIASTGDPRARS